MPFVDRFFLRNSWIRYDDAMSGRWYLWFYLIIPYIGFLIWHFWFIFFLFFCSTETTTIYLSINSICSVIHCFIINVYAYIIIKEGFLYGFATFQFVFSFWDLSTSTKIFLYSRFSCWKLLRVLSAWLIRDHEAATTKKSICSCWRTHGGTSAMQLRQNLLPI